MHGGTAWGEGPAQVTLRAASPAVLPALPVDGYPVEVRGESGLVIPVGDEGVGQILVRWGRGGDCAYAMWLEPPLGLEHAIQYAEDY